MPRRGKIAVVIIGAWLAVGILYGIIYPPGQRNEGSTYILMVLTVVAAFAVRWIIRHYLPKPAKQQPDATSDGE